MITPTNTMNAQLPADKDPENSKKFSTQQVKVNPITKIMMGASLAAAELLSLGHILDRIKTHQQANPGQFNGWQSAKYIYKNKGFLGFYTGVQWNVLTHSGKAAFRWAVMGYMDDLWHRTIPKNLNSQYPSLQPTLLGISVSFLEATCLVCPAEVLKTKEMTSSLKNYKFIPYMNTIGWKHLFDGVDVVLFRQAVSWISFLVAYKKTNQFALDCNEGKKLNLLQQFGVGGVAGAINVLFTTPFDSLKTQVQKDNPLKAKYIFSAFNEMRRNHGLKSLYSGLSVRMLRSTYYAGLTLTLMERLGIFRSHHA